MRVALDSNILICAEANGEGAKRAIVFKLLEAADVDFFLSLQAAGEGMRWMIRKGGLSKSNAAVRAQEWLSTATPIETTRAVFDDATVLIAEHACQVWDAIILAGAASAHADVLLSEDMQDGFRWRGVTVVNPFAEKPAAIVARLLGGR